MISAAGREGVRESLHVVGASINEISRTFYATLFRDNPDLLHRLFNRGNQANGEQQEALANGLVGFAALVVHRPYIEISTVLQRIAHKHASVGVRPEQYEIIHDHLMSAFSAVLGAALTERRAAAWSELYWVVARALIAEEDDLYRSFNIRPGENWRRWTVVQRVQETRRIMSLVLEPADEYPVDPFRAGQYVSVAVPLSESSFQIRQYSISSAPGSSRLRITVERLEGPGRPVGEVSSFMHDRVTLGDELLLSPPFGEVVLDDTEDPLLFVSSGVGISPFISMLHTLVGSGAGREVTYVHVDESREEHALRFELDDLLAALPDARRILHYTNPSGPLRGAQPGPPAFAALGLSGDTRAYLCGTPSRMRTWRADLVRAGLNPLRMRYEVFGPDLWRNYS